MVAFLVRLSSVKSCAEDWEDRIGMNRQEMQQPDVGKMEYVNGK